MHYRSRLVIDVPVAEEAVQIVSSRKIQEIMEQLEVVATTLFKDAGYSPKQEFDSHLTYHFHDAAEDQCVHCRQNARDEVGFYA